MRDITQLHPLAQAKASELVRLCTTNGLSIKITDCVRNAEEQEDCVRRGTSSCHYPNSMHNWGVAFDFCRNDGTGGYNNTDGFFQKVGKLGESIGLEWGGSWTSPVDMPHFQLADWGTGTQKLKALYGTPENFKATWKQQEVKKEELALLSEQEKRNYVTNLYALYLGREADESGLIYWVSKIKDDTRLIDLEREFAQTEEARKHCVENAYYHIFNRKGDNVGVSYWTDWLKTHRLTELYTQFYNLKKKGNK